MRWAGSAEPAPRRVLPPLATILGVGTAVPATSYTQEEVLDLFQVTDPRIRGVFLNGGIERRNLCLPSRPADGTPHETQDELLRKHRTVGLEIGRQAIAACLASCGRTLAEIEYLCCVSSTGLLTPGFSAHLIKELGIPHTCSRLDVVGMGCNAGLNALAAVTGWSHAHPGKLALMVCIEVCSAMYVFDGSINTAVVNSLFGDGAAALALTSHGDAAAGNAATGDAAAGGPHLLRFSSCIIPDAIDAMRIDWSELHGKFSFALEPEVPYVVGASAEGALDRLLDGAGLRRSDIAHWLVHSGGRKVVDAVRVNFRISRHDVRHTLGVLRDHGNLSSGSFLFSYERLAREGCVAPGDLGVMMTMGPGSTIEMALVQW